MSINQISANENLINETTINEHNNISEHIEVNSYENSIEKIEIEKTNIEEKNNEIPNYKSLNIEEKNNEIPNYKSLNIEEKNNEIPNYESINLDNISKFTDIGPNSSIQEIIDNSKENDTLILEKGIYNQSNIKINKSLTITSNGNPNETIINGNNNNIFQINNEITVNFVNLMFINGNSENGGAINNNESGKLTIANCIFENNSAKSNGGAINTYHGELAISNSTFINNKANYDGGAIAIHRFSKTTINNSIFINNTAKEWGGAVYNWLTDNTIANSKFYNNSANFGGGIMNSGKIAINNSELINNKADIGGAIYNYNDTVIANLNCIYNNTANLKGDDIYIYQSDLKSNFEDNWWGINNPLNNSNYFKNWSSRLEYLFNTIEINSWMNLNGIIVNNSSSNKLVSNLKSSHSNKTFELNLPVELNISNISSIKYLNNGTAVFKLPNLTIETKLTLDYENIIFNKDNKTKVFSYVNNFNESYGANKNFTACLKDINGNFIVGAEISFVLYNINGDFKVYERTTNTEGIAKLAINLNPNNFTIQTLYEGNKNYSASISELANLTVYKNNNKTIMIANNLNQKYGENNNFTTKLLDENNNPIPGKEICLVLKNYLGEFKDYWRTTNTEGIAKLSIGLIPGNWTITAYYQGDNTYDRSNDSTGNITITS